MFLYGCFLFKPLITNLYLCAYVCLAKGEQLLVFFVCVCMLFAFGHNAQHAGS